MRSCCCIHIYTNSYSQLDQQPRRT